MGFLDTRTLSSSNEFRSVLLSMYIKAPESTTNYLSSGSVKNGAGRHQTSEGERNVDCPSFELENTFCHFPCVSAGASFLLEGFFFRSVLTFWSIKTTFMRYNSLGWTLSFPTFHVAQLRVGSQEFPSRKIDLAFGGSTSWNKQPNCLEFLNMATGPLPPVFFRFFCWADCQPLFGNSLNLHPDCVL